MMMSSRLKLTNCHLIQFNSAKIGSLKLQINGSEIDALYFNIVVSKKGSINDRYRTQGRAEWGSC